MKFSITFLFVFTTWVAVTFVMLRMVAAALAPVRCGITVDEWFTLSTNERMEIVGQQIEWDVRADICGGNGKGSMGFYPLTSEQFGCLFWKDRKAPRFFRPYEPFRLTGTIIHGASVNSFWIGDAQELPLPPPVVVAGTSGGIPIRTLNVDP